MIVDGHVHVVGNPDSTAPEYVDVIRDAVLLRRRHPDVFASHWGKLEDMSDLLIEDMDAFGIDKAVIQPARGESPELVAQAVDKYPDRLVGLFMSGYSEFVGGDAAVVSGPSQKPDLNQFADNVRHWVRDLGLRGLGEFGVRTFSEESDPSKIARDLMPVIEIINEYRIPVLIHTAWTQFGTKLYHGIPMFVDDLAEQFPETPFTLTKMGRGYNFIFEICLALATKHDNVYLDTVQSPAEHVARAVREVGAERVIYGTDWDPTWRPLNLPEGIYARTLAVIDDAGLTDGQKEQVLGKTAATLYGMCSMEA